LDREELDALRAEIEARHGTVYRFWKRSGLNKSSVYMVLAGTYPGDAARQIKRIQNALDGRGGPAERVFQAIKATACARCARTTKCGACDGLFRAQAKAAMEAMDE